MQISLGLASPSKLRLLADLHRISAAQKVKITAQRRLKHMAQEELAITALEGRRRWIPAGAAAGQFLIADMQMQSAVRRVKLDFVAVLHQRQRPAQRTFRRGMQNNRAVRRAAHAGIRNPQHIPNPLPQQFARNGQMADFRHAWPADGPGVLQDKNMVFADIQVGVVNPRLDVIDSFEDDGRAAVPQEFGRGGGVFDDRAIGGQIAAECLNRLQLEAACRANKSRLDS